MTPNRRLLQTAQIALRAHLERLFGPELRGVSAFGPGLDLKTRDVALRVMVEDAATKRVAAALPASIEDVPVRVQIGGPSNAE